MKKILYLLIGISLLGCDDFLNEQPISNVSLGNFFVTEADFEEAINGAYKTLHPVYSGESGRGAASNFSEIRSDNSTYQYNPVHQGWYEIWDLDKFLVVSSNQAVRWTWNSTYSGIGACNVVLHYLEGKDFENKNRIEAEAKFLRALYYFHLVKNFGDVPLVTTKVNSMEEAFSLNKRTKKELVYDQIISDLNFAKSYLPLNYPSNQIGKATKGAAQTLLADVLMWNDDYSGAAKELEEIINDNQYRLLNDYTSVFDINNENNDEIIFSVQYLAGPYGLSSIFMYNFLPYNIGRDKLPFQNGDNFGINIPTEDLIKSFEQNDQRLKMIDTSFVYKGYEHLGAYNDSIVPFTLKFNDMQHTERMNTGTNFNVYRYPHVLLMLAECYLRVGGGDPIPLVNMVRNRAGLNDLSNVTLDDIIHERRVEFHCEDDRWYVLVRTGKAVEVMKAHGEREKKRRSDFSKDSFNEIKILLPIPSTVIENDPTIQQNEEYL